MSADPPIWLLQARIALRGLVLSVEALAAAGEDGVPPHTLGELDATVGVQISAVHALLADERSTAVERAKRDAIHCCFVQIVRAHGVFVRSSDKRQAATTLFRRIAQAISTSANSAGV